YRWPIVGRPRAPEDRAEYRFGRHLQAVGRLLQASGDEQFARAAIAKFHRSSEGRRAGARTDEPSPVRRDRPESKPDAPPSEPP
ncbi:MAG: hypothetical protein ACRC1K_18370, partial [Planctomycetia bacterium]